MIGDPLVEFDPGYVFPALVGARAEAVRVADLLGVPPLLGADATIGRVTEAGRNARLVHIAAHGVAFEDSPLSSFLALADGRLTAADIQSACFPASLVVLSACQSGLGRSVEGGVIGVARAFNLAGAQQIVMSLWSVDDRSAEQLMRTFWGTLVDHTGRGLHVSESLRRASLEVREQYPNPRDWAAFAVFGAPPVSQ